MAELLLLQGPAGSNKSARARQLLIDDYDVLADYTQLWAALTGAVRDSVTGLYPVRTAADPIVRSGLVSYVQRAAIRQALRKRLKVIATTATSGQEAVYERIAAEGAAAFKVETIDPGKAVVTERLKAQADGVLLDECNTAINRWYG